MNQHLFAFSTLAEPESTRRPSPKSASPQKVLRPPLLLGRAKAVSLTPLLEPLARECGVDESSVGATVLALAREIARRSPIEVSEHWLEKLATGVWHGQPCRRLPVSASTKHWQPTARLPVPHAAFDALPRFIWSEPALLGEWLAVARAKAASRRPKSAQGRAGRIPCGCVFTPPPLARTIIAELHVGARRVVDPACGAGVFLLEAFRRAYLRRLEAGATPLHAAEAALSHELSGVDIDPQALAVAEFSLRMAALRCAGLTQDVPIDLRLADALEDLPGLDGQCECIVGNPPFIEGRGLSPAKLSALRRKFRTAASGKINLFAVFVERALSLLEEDGVLTFIIPATFQRNERYLVLRELLLEHTLEAIKPLDSRFFSQRAVETVLLRVRKKPPRRGARVRVSGGVTLQSRLPLGPGLRFCDHLSARLRRQIEVMERHGVLLGECFEVRDGISTGFQPFPSKLLGTLEDGHFQALDGVRRPFDPALHKKIIDGTEFSAFSPVQWAERYIHYDKAIEHDPPHPGRPFNCQLRDPWLYDRPEKILTRQTAKGLIATVDRQRYFVRNSVHVTFARANSLLPLREGSGGVVLSLDALCACLNTRFYSDYFLAVTGESGEVFPQVHIADIKRLPVLPGLLKPDGELAALGGQLLQLHLNADSAQAEIHELKCRLEVLLANAFGI